MTANEKLNNANQLAKQLQAKLDAREKQVQSEKALTDTASSEHRGSTKIEKHSEEKKTVRKSRPNKSKAAKSRDNSSYIEADVSSNDENQKPVNFKNENDADILGILDDDEAFVEKKGKRQSNRKGKTVAKKR